MRRVWETYNASAGEVETGGGGSARVFTLPISSQAPGNAVTSRPALLADAGSRLLANEMLPHSSSHNLDGVAGMVATAASVTGHSMKL
jgi:hypothetical protein